MSKVIIALVQHPSGEWKESTFDVNDSGELMTIDNVDNFQNPSIFYAYDHEKKSIYWLAIDNKCLYRIDYNRQTKTAEKAILLGSSNSNVKIFLPLMSWKNR